MIEPIESFTVSPDTRDIAPEVLDADGNLRILPTAYWATTTAAERAAFGNRHAIYSFPTTELVEHVTAIIGGRSAIEIGAGHGGFARALGIPGTDSKMQERNALVHAVYALTRQPTVRYGPDVIEAHASRAVRRFRSQVVVACWVTRVLDRARPQDGGLDHGVDELDVLRQVETYVFIGNEKVHAHSRLWSRPHLIEYPPFVVSRALNGSRDFIAVVRGGR